MVEAYKRCCHIDSDIGGETPYDAYTSLGSWRFGGGGVLGVRVIVVVRLASVAREVFGGESSELNK